ncbi:hypothetical protein [Streptomyces sp. MI02-7b]|uniref:hypothetical protein n=1 Tax=Streptomyces sp. MI02-7b TaxID=462941 RepID=UPI0029A1D8CB|nr:hypothetical protein [Streptomyces sp. MI02-7b]MDX3073606.1 hypothetical protein [Streptomyces sp. MI02-7b]
MRNGTSRDREQEPGAEDEWELSVLLERTVPQPLAPTDRMAQVRRRVQRRRRRRMAALSTAAVAAVGVGALTVTGLTWGAADPHRRTVATPAAAGTATSAATPPPTSTSMPSAGTDGDAYTTVHLKDLYGLTLRLPRGWKGFTTLDQDAMMIGFVSQQPMHQQASCGTTPDLGYSACPPVGTLGRGAALIYIHKTMYTKTDGKAGFDVVEPGAPGKGCQVLHGDAEMQAWGGIPTTKDRPLLLNVDVCLREPSQDTVAAIRKALETARFPQG